MWQGDVVGVVIRVCRAHMKHCRSMLHVIAGSQEGGDDEDNDEANDADQGGVAAAEQAEASSDSEAEGDGMLPGVGDGAFRYRKVPKADYGLSVEEMLTMDPKELNQVQWTSTLHANTRCCSLSYCPSAYHPSLPSPLHRSTSYCLWHTNVHCHSTGTTPAL